MLNCTHRPTATRVNLEHIEKLSCLYLANCRNFPWQLASPFMKDYDMQKLLFDKTVGHELSKQFPPAGEFLNNFIKTWIRKAGDGVVLEDIYDTLSSLLASPLSNKGYRLYTFDNCQTFLATEETMAMCSKGTTGLQAWRACFLACVWATKNPSLFSNKRVIELGCGVGLLGATISRLSPTQVTLTDHHSSVLASAHRTVTVNRLEHVAIEELDWREPREMECDVVVAADVVFDPALLPDLSLTIKRLLRPDNVCYVFSTVRNEATFHEFVRCISEAGLKSEHLDLSGISHYLVESVSDLRLLSIRL